jgi:hypothetical protein
VVSRLLRSAGRPTYHGLANRRRPRLLSGLDRNRKNRSNPFGGKAMTTAPAPNGTIPVAPPRARIHRMTVAGVSRLGLARTPQLVAYRRATPLIAPGRESS